MSFSQCTSQQDESRNKKKLQSFSHSPKLVDENQYTHMYIHIYVCIYHRPSLELETRHWPWPFEPARLPHGAHSRTLEPAWASFGRSIWLLEPARPRWCARGWEGKVKGGNVSRRNVGGQVVRKQTCERGVCAQNIQQEAVSRKSVGGLVVRRQNLRTIVQEVGL